ncbi:MAG TPA: hypothetical protein VHX52_10555 [Steroidobacteraceae bacterium]|jgi:hypothetical protein|nr:hypothetical protein [Steroidobacteraceae bacterium]
MMIDLSARLEAAALFLAGPGSIKDRLSDAYRTHLQDIPESDRTALGDEFAEMIQALHREHALPGDDVVRASVRKLSNQQVHHYAELVVRLYGLFAGVRQELGRTRAPRTLPGAPPKYLPALPAENGANH